jgi:hypothetical protein
MQPFLNVPVGEHVPLQPRGSRSASGCALSLAVLSAPSTEQFFTWCCTRLQEADVRVEVLTWDKASWHVSIHTIPMVAAPILP